MVPAATRSDPRGGGGPRLARGVGRHPRRARGLAPNPEPERTGHGGAILLSARPRPLHYPSWRLRAILGRYLATDSSRLQFNYGGRGKPALAAPYRYTQLRFNVSRSD